MVKCLHIFLILLSEGRIEVLQHCKGKNSALDFEFMYIHLYSKSCSCFFKSRWDKHKKSWKVDFSFSLSWTLMINGISIKLFSKLTIHDFRKYTILSIQYFLIHFIQWAAHGRSQSKLGANVANFDTASSRYHPYSSHLSCKWFYQLPFCRSCLHSIELF